MAGAAIDVILFDLGGVLVELAGVEKMLEWSPGIDSTEELWRRWLRSDAVRRFETGATDRDAFARDVIAEFGVPVPADEFLAAFTWWPRAVLPGAHELLASLRDRYRLASVSNTNEIHWARFSGQWSLDRAFHHNFPSHLVGQAEAGRRVLRARGRGRGRARGARAVHRRQRHQRGGRRAARPARAARRRRRGCAPGFGELGLLE